MGISKDLNESDIKQRKADLDKIKKYLIRQTSTDGNLEDLESWQKLKQMTFLEFLVQVGMFSVLKPPGSYNQEEIEQAKTRYINALSASVRGTGAIIHKRNVKDVFTNGFNMKFVQLHQANHDIQIVIDQFACAQYVCGYLTKNEGGISKLLSKLLATSSKWKN